MNNSRSQIMAQIARANKLLLAQQNEVQDHQKYLTQKNAYEAYFKTSLVLLVGFYIGWGIERRNFNKKWIKHIVNVGPVLLGVGTSMVWNLAHPVVNYLVKYFISTSEK